MRGTPFTLVRSPEGLSAICHTWKKDFWDNWSELTIQDIERSYGSETIPLTQKNVARWTEFKPVLQTWNNLKQAAFWNDSTLTDFLHILIETNPCFGSVAPSPSMLDIPEPPRLTKKTAANPRGLRRGKRKKQEELINFQSLLCDGKNIKHLLTNWEPLWPQAMRNLKKRGYDTARLSELSSEKLNAVNIYLGIHFPGAPFRSRVHLPEHFSRDILPNLNSRSWKEVLQYLKLYWDLNLENNPDLLACISRLLYRLQGEVNNNWSRVLTSLAPDRRNMFSVFLTRSDLMKKPVEGKYSRQVIELLNGIPNEQIKETGCSAIWALRDGISPKYFQAGVALSTRFDDQIYKPPLRDCPDFPENAVNSLLNHLERSNRFYDRIWYRLWVDSAEVPRMTAQIKTAPWHRLKPDIANALLAILFNNRVSSKDTAKAVNRWEYILDQIPTITTHLNSIHPDFQTEFLDNIRVVIYNTMSKKGLKRVLPRALRFLSRVCGPPFNREGTGILSVFYILFDTPDKRLEEFFKGDDSCFLKLQNACRSENNARLVRRGIDDLCFHSINFTLDGFLNYPATFCRVAKNLGTLPQYLRHQLIKILMRHPLMKIDLSKISAKRLHHLIQNKCPESIKNPIPKKLRQHFEERIELTPNRVAGYTQKFRAKIPQVRLELLDHLVWERLQKPFGKTPKKKDWEHTFQMLYWMDDNRRSLRECIRSYIGGNWDYVEQHPETVRWLKKVPELDFKKWKEGLALRREFEKFGLVRLEIEQNPLEILKMGTYVGSCLGLGGHYTFNAATVLLDINKQVLYARDSNKKVLGRQLIAISKEKHLVCFSVYPYRAPAAIKKLFVEYNLELSRKIGMPLLRPDKNSSEDVEYEIESILSQDWYDDYLWNKLEKN